MKLLKAFLMTSFGAAVLLGYLILIANYPSIAGALFLFALFMLFVGVVHDNLS
tara:strand:- start:13172 stop:13330 length:159 start_codon:yes stop_codon:yes gene_type:complete